MLQIVQRLVLLQIHVILLNRYSFGCKLVGLIGWFNEEQNYISSHSVRRHPFYVIRSASLFRTFKNDESVDIVFCNAC